MAKNKRRQSSQSSQPPQTPLNLPPTTPGQAVRLDPRSLLEAGDRVLIVDCRSGSERRPMAIVGAVRYDPRRFEAEHPDKKTPVVCVSWMGGRSLVAAYRLAKQGYQAYDLKGGIIAWKRAGLPTVRDF